MSPNRQGYPPDVTTTFLDVVARQRPSSQEKRGDEKLDQARAMRNEFESVIADNDLRIIEDKITHARELREGLDSKTGISKYKHSREYRKASKDALRYAKGASDRGKDQAQFRHQSGTSSGPDSRVITTARSVYRCLLSCKEAFPSAGLKEELETQAWNDACARTGAGLLVLPQSKNIACSNISLVTDIKMKIKHDVQSLYGFNTSRAPNSISDNATRAHALLTKRSFVYGEPNFGSRPNHIYRHPIIQRVINITWFYNRDDDGIVFHEYFAPVPTLLPIEVIALALTVIECCIYEWADGTCNESNWREERYETAYRSHLNSLKDLRAHGQRQQGGVLLAKIQYDLLKSARIHAGATSDPVTGSGQFGIEDLNAAIQNVTLQDGLPEYDQVPAIRVNRAR